MEHTTTTQEPTMPATETPQMTPREAATKQREPVKVGDERTFYRAANMVDTGLGATREISGQTVRVIEALPHRTHFKRWFLVQSALPRGRDAHEFQAHEEELNGYCFDLGQWTGPRRP